MPVRHYSELIAWQKSMDVVEEVNRHTECFPQREIFGITNQMRRAAVSVPSNIAEGQGRATTNDFLHFLHIARGSLQELETQTILSKRLSFLQEGNYDAMMARMAEVARVLNGLIKSLQNPC